MQQLRPFKKLAMAKTVAGKCMETLTDAGCRSAVCAGHGRLIGT